MILTYINTDSFQMIFETTQTFTNTIRGKINSKKRATNGKYITF